jgi:O-antigen/teichoic acid export membrane protein
MKQNVRGAILTSLVIQGAGSVIPFVNIVALARLAGPVTQGTFSTFKTWMDLVTSLIVFGFPQAFVYLLNKKMANRDQLLNISLLYTLASSLFVIPIAMYSITSGYNILPEDRSIFAYATLLSAGVGAVVLNRLVRAIYLTIDDGLLFALITSAPALFMFATMMVAAMFTPFHYDIAFFAAGVLTLTSTGVWIRRIIVETPGYRLTLSTIPKRALAEQSIHTFVQSVSFTLQPVATISLLFHFGGAVTDVALFTAATIAIAAVNAFFGIVAPILFNRWSRNIDDNTLRGIQAISDRVSLGFLVLSVAALPLYPVLVPAIFGTDYVAAIPAFQIISCAIAPVALTRIITSAIHAAGRPEVNTISCILRLAVSVAAQLVLSYSGLASPLMAAAAGWMIAEWIAAVYSRWMERRIILCQRS